MRILIAEDDPTFGKLLQKVLSEWGYQVVVARDGSEGYSIEVFNALGETIAVTAVQDSALEPLREDEVLCARVLAAA